MAWNLSVCKFLFQVIKRVLTFFSQNKFILLFGELVEGFRNASKVYPQFRFVSRNKKYYVYPL